MSATEFKTPTYPVVTFLVAHGASCSVVLSVLVGIICSAIGWSAGLPWLIPVGIGFAAALLVVLLSYIEVLRIISDTLLPKY